MKTSEWQFNPCENFRNNLKQAKLDLSDELATASSTLLSPHKTAIAETFEWQKYCSYEELLRIEAYMLRFLSKSNLYKTSTVEITDPAELETAAQHLFHIVPTESFPMEKSNLLKSSSLSSKSKTAQCSPFIGSIGLARAYGRTKQLEVATFDVKYPIILDARHPLIRLLLEHLHTQHFHQRVDYLRALVQQRFAVVKLRTALRTIVSSCVVCRKRKAETLNPIMADLPRERLAFKDPPFSNTGVDYFGPLFVSVKRSTEKRWGFLFTCLSTRAVHFEVVPSMDTSSCVMGTKKFCACRGFPSVIWSDNGTNFVASKKELLLNIQNRDQ